MLRLSRRFSKTSQVCLGMLLGLVLSACGGTKVPAGLSVGGETGSESLDSKSFTVNVRVNGEDGGGSSASATSGRFSKGSASTRSAASSRRKQILESRFGQSSFARSSQTSAASNDNNGSGGNGRDVVGLDGTNYYVSGLATADLEATVRFIAEGDQDILAEIAVTSEGNSEVTLADDALGAGQNLQVEIITTNSTSSAIVPSTFFAEGGRFGFNLLRRPDGNLIVELFPDVEPPFNASDNGTRVIVDTAVDCFKDGVLGTAARFESPDGLVLWDINLDGVFGSPLDACRLFDTNGDGVIDSADTPVSLALDPNLDGVTGDDEERLLGNNVPEDFINGINISVTPDNVVGNGSNTVTVFADITPARDGLPIGAIVNFSAELTEGTASEIVEGVPSDPRFVRNDLPSIARTIDPFDPTVMIEANGQIRLQGTVRVPFMETEGVIKVTLSYLTSSSDEPREAVAIVNVTENLSPSLKRVNFSGTEAIPAGVSGLREASEAAYVVHGNPVEIVGTNFSNDITAFVVTFNGIEANILEASEDGTSILVDVPNEAVTGRIAVIQDGLAAQTTEDFMISGAPLLISSTLPEDGASGTARDGVVIIRFNQPIDVSSIQDGLEIATAADTPVVGTTQVADDGQSLTFIPANDLAASTSFTVTVNGNLSAASGARFDPDVSNTVLASDEDPVVITGFTTGTSLSTDATAPTVDAATTELVQPTEFGEAWTITVGFSEAMRASSIFSSEDANETDSIRLRRDSDSSLVDIVVALSVDGESANCIIEDDLFGLEDYILEVSTDAKDIAGNALAATSTTTFTVPLHLTRLSAISGPVGSEILIEGSTFDLAATDIAFNGADAEIVDISTAEILVKVLSNATDGPLTVSVGAQTATAPRDFVVTSSGFVIRDIVEGAGAFGIAIDRDNNALVSFQNAGEIGLVDMSTESARDTNPETEEVDHLNVGGIPTEALLDRTGELGFTTNFGQPPVPGEAVAFIDTINLKVLGAVTVGRRPTRLAISPDNRLLFVTNFIDDSVSVIDVSNRSVIATMDVGNGPNGIVIAPDNERGYVANFLDGTVSVFNTATLSEIGRIVVGQNPARCALSPDSETLFVTNFTDGTISVINARTLAVTHTVSGLEGPTAMAFLPSGSQFFVTNRNNNTVQDVKLNQTSGLWELGDIRIATPDVPAGVAVTADGARLAITSEGAGKLSVVALGNPQPTILQFARDVDDEPEDEILTADVRRKVWIIGRGFGNDVNNISATLNGKDLEIDTATFERSRFRVTVPADATSGPVVVTLQSLEAGGAEKLSNEHTLVITSKNPRIVTMYPGDGSTQAPVDTNVVLEFSEPLDLATIFNEEGEIRKLQGQPVMRLQRLPDVPGGEATVISGTWTADADNIRFTFELAPNVTLQKGASNNRYEVVVNPSVRDLFANQVVGAVTSFGSSSDTELGSATTSGIQGQSFGFRGRFQTIDLLGPYPTSALIRDLNNNGVDEGDELILGFNEKLFFEVLELDLLDADGSGTDAVTLANGGDSVGSTLLATLGSTPRRVRCQLGAGAALTIGSSGINFVDQAVNAFRDFAGNRPIANPAGDVTVEIDTTSDNNDNPRLLAAAWLDTNNSSTVNAGDTLRLIFNEPVVAGAGATTPATLFALSAGSLGAATFLPQSAGSGRELDIQLGAGASFAVGATIAPVGSGLPTLMNDDEITDFAGNPAYAGDYATVSISSGLPGVPTLSVSTPPEHFDLQGTPEGLSVGDAIILTFTAPVVMNPSGDGEGRVLPSAAFPLGVEGDRYGTGASISHAPVLTLADGSQRFIQPTEIVIILGANPVLTPGGTFGLDIFN